MVDVVKNPLDKATLTRQVQHLANACDPSCSLEMATSSSSSAMTDSKVFTERIIKRLSTMFDELDEDAKARIGQINPGKESLHPLWFAAESTVKIENALAEKDQEVKKVIAEKDQEVKKVIAEKDQEKEKALAEKDQEKEKVIAEKDQNVAVGSTEENSLDVSEEDEVLSENGGDREFDENPKSFQQTIDRVNIVIKAFEQLDAMNVDPETNGLKEVKRALAELASRRSTEKTLALIFADRPRLFNEKVTMEAGPSIAQFHPNSVFSFLEEFDPTDPDSVAKAEEFSDVWEPYGDGDGNHSSTSIWLHKASGLLRAFAEKPTARCRGLISKWETEKFFEFLEGASEASINGTRLFDRIFNQKVIPFFEEKLRGKYREGTFRVYSEGECAIALTTTVEHTLCELFRAGLPDDVDFACRILSSDKRNNPSIAHRRGRNHRTLEVCFEQGKDEKSGYPVCYSVAFILSETKAPFTSPCRSGEDRSVREFANLLDICSSEDDRASRFRNDLVKIGHDMCSFQRRHGILCSLDGWTFLELNERGELKVSNVFWADKEPKRFCLMEILMRFLLASVGKWMPMQRPNNMLPYRPRPFTNYLRNYRDRKDEEGVAEGPGPSSSSSSRLPNDKIGPFGWADLEDNRRSAQEEVLSWRDAVSPFGELEGDAKYFARGCTGAVYRKEIDGVDMIIKVVHSLEIPEDEYDPTGADLLQALENEAKMYDIMRSLQGDVVPRFFGLRDICVHGIVLSVTEYVGKAYSCQETLTLTQARSAMDALGKIHSLYLLHEAVQNLRNVMWNEKLGRAFFIDMLKAREISPDEDSEEVKRQERDRLAKNLKAKLGAADAELFEAFLREACERSNKPGSYFFANKRQRESVW